MIGYHNNRLQGRLYQNHPVSLKLRIKKRCFKKRMNMLLIGPSIPFRWREGHPRVQQHNRACPTVLADLSDSIGG